MRPRSWLMMAALALLATEQNSSMSQLFRLAVAVDHGCSLAAGSGIDVLARVLAPRRTG